MAFRSSWLSKGQGITLTGQALNTGQEQDGPLEMLPVGKLNLYFEIGG